MALQVGDFVRVTRGDMRGYVGIIRRPLRTSLHGGRTYGVEFPGETSLSNFRASNIEAAKEQDVVPEFLEINNVVLRLRGDEPYELITGGLMGKRRRYWLAVIYSDPPSDSHVRISCRIARSISISSFGTSLSLAPALSFISGTPSESSSGSFTLDSYDPS